LLGRTKVDRIARGGNAACRNRKGIVLPPIRNVIPIRIAGGIW
jgi:hypothetical protein